MLELRKIVTLCQLTLWMEVKTKDNDRTNKKYITQFLIDGNFISSLVLIPVNWFAYVHSVRMVLQREKEKKTNRIEYIKDACCKAGA